MSRPASLAVLALPLLVAACFSRGAIHSRRTEGGRPLAEPGSEAYLVWHDGGRWHLRVRSEAPHLFHGSVGTGHVRDLTTAGVPEGAVRAEGDAVAFSFVASGPTDAGFDWRGGRCPELSLYIDGEARPMRIFTGAYGANPPRVPYTVCLGGR